MELEEYSDVYSKSLFNGSTESEIALKYLVESRGLTEDTIREIGIGYCPVDGDVPGETIHQKNSNRPLKGGIVLPIKSEFNTVIALAARKPSPDVKGWWNQSFTKSNHLFLFNQSRKHVYEKDKIYLVEGYFDAIIPWQYGLKNIVCLMGTSLGMRRIGLISRYCENVCLMLDTDEEKNGKEGSGQKAQRHIIGELAASGINGVSKINLPVKIDPDMFVINHGIESLLEREEIVSQYEKKMAKKEYLDKSRR